MELQAGEEAFGQTVSLTGRISAVLRGYPEVLPAVFRDSLLQGVTILKELLQNADDATASTLKLCHDKRDHARGNGNHQCSSRSLTPFSEPPLPRARELSR